MKHLVSSLFGLFLGFCMSGQIITSNVQIAPPMPTVQDSITISFTVYFVDYGVQGSGALSIQHDSIQFSACYFCGCFEQTDAPVNYSVSINPLSEGYYHVFLIQNFVPEIADTNCSNIVYRDTIDTFFVVSPATGIINPPTCPFYAMLLSATQLKITGEAVTDIDIEVYDATGRIIGARHKAPVQQGNNIIGIEMENLAAGMYFYKIQGGDKEQVLKYLKE